MTAGTLVFDYPSVEEAAKYLHKSVAPVVITAESLQKLPAAMPTGRVPKEGSLIRMHSAARLPQSQALLRRSSPTTAAERSPEDIIGVVPWGRWDIDASGATKKQPKIRFGAWIGDVETFDAGVFGISGPEAQLMDPQQRLLLEVAHEALYVGPF
jgi:Beta-ketoacyl synthase, N-terminal domain